MGDSLGSELAHGEGEVLASESLARGTRLGRYELLVPVAVGGMARVWAARLHGQLGFTKLVAIKTILPHLASDPEFERMLADEARIASEAGHPNIVEVYELGEERGVVYVAMEWVYGDSLSQILRSAAAPATPPGGATSATPDRGSVPPGSTTLTPLDPRIAARIVADAAAGLHAAHNLTDEDGRSLEVVHRDVSPHNLLVSLDGNVKVTDFGVAKVIGATHQATTVGQLKGKIAYMAPEQASGAAVDRRSDVFSLGCVLYEATTGKRPFRGDGDHQVLQELIKGSFAPPSRVVRGYPFDLERIVLRAMAAQPLHRYPSMDQLRIALEEWLAKGGTVVTQSNVALVVKERIGADVEKRREKIRLASQASASSGERDSQAPRASSLPAVTISGRASQPPSPRMTEHAAPLPAEARTSFTTLTPPVSSFPPVIETTARLPSRTDYVMAASLGVIAAAALGASGFWVWSSMQSASSRVASAANTPLIVAPAESPISVAPVPPPTGTAALLSPAVTFKITPETAVLVVNGAALPLSVRSIPRPLAGITQDVIVRADGFEEQTFSVDESSPFLVSVWLDEAAPLSEPTPAGAAADASLTLTRELP